MSKTESETKGRGREWSAKFTRTVKFYDSNFDYQSATISDEIVPAKTVPEAIASFGFSNDEVVAILNNAAKLALIESKTKEVMGDGAVSESVLMKFIEPYRNVKRFAAITPKKDQTAAIMLKIKADEDAIEALRALMSEGEPDPETEEKE